MIGSPRYRGPQEPAKVRGLLAEIAESARDYDTHGTSLAARVLTAGINQHWSLR
jgi:hypothetical protein